MGKFIFWAAIPIGICFSCDSTANQPPEILSMEMTVDKTRFTPTGYVAESASVKVVARDREKKGLSIKWSAPFGSFGETKTTSEWIPLADDDPRRAKNYTHDKQVTFTNTHMVPETPSLYFVQAEVIDAKGSRASWREDLHVGRFMGAARSTDGGQSWSNVTVDGHHQVPIGFGEWFYRVGSYESLPLNPNDLWEHAGLNRAFQVLAPRPRLLAIESSGPLPFGALVPWLNWFGCAFGAEDQCPLLTVGSLLFSSEDEGSSWKWNDFAGGLPRNHAFTAVAWSAEEGALYVAGSEMTFKIRESEGGGIVVSSAGREFTGKVYGMVDSRLKLFRSLDVGESWEEVAQIQPLEQQGRMIIPLGLELSENEPPRLVLHGLLMETALFISDPYPRKDKPILDYAIEWADEISGFALHSEDGGHSWTPFDGSEPQGSFILPKACGGSPVAMMHAVGDSGRTMVGCGEVMALCETGDCRRVGRIPASARAFRLLSDLIGLLNNIVGGLQLGIPADDPLANRVRELILEGLEKGAPKAAFDAIIAPWLKQGSLFVDPVEGSLWLSTSGPMFVGPTLRSTDGGENWEEVEEPGPTARIEADPANPKRWFAFCYPEEPSTSLFGVVKPSGQIKVTEDGGKTWNVLFRSAPFGMFGRVSFLENGTLIAGVP